MKKTGKILFYLFISYGFLLCSAAARGSTDYPGLLERCMKEFETGEYEKAVITAKEIIKKNEKSVIGRICLGSSYDELNKKQEAINVLKEAEQLAEEKDHLITIYNRLGSLFLEVNNLSMAMQYNQMLLNLAKLTGNRLQEATALTRIGDILTKEGDYYDAITYYKRAIDIATDVESKVLALNGLGYVYVLLNNPDEAIKYYSTVLEYQKQKGDQRSVAESLLNLGNVYRLKGDLKKAEKLLLEGMEKIKDQKDPFWEATGHRYIAWLYMDMNRRGAALLQLQVAKDLFESNKFYDYAEEVQKEITEFKAHKR